MRPGARHRHALKSYLADVGPGIDALPWRSPREAARALTVADRHALARFRRRATRAFLTPQPHLEIAGALGELIPGDAVAVHPGAPPGGTPWFAQTFLDRARPTEAPIANHSLLPAVRLYELDRRDPFANRPVACAPLFAGATTGNDPLTFVEAILEANGLVDQMRMVVYEADSLQLFSGFYRTRHGRRYGEREHALLLAARPGLRAWARTACAIGGPPVGEGALALVLNAFDRPAYLTRRGRVVFANHAGARSLERVRAWERERRPEGFATVTPLHVDRAELDLVLPHDVAPSGALSALPPSLGRVGALLAAGLSDKEIARETSMAHATVRTYVTRIFRRIGVNGRRELMQRMRERE